ncbi:MAG: Alcohol dehydrogenase GroES domain protein [Candidatus Solibacter sp.]|nr:Alcohol dehydrogenase GroES domain protein [Candidatus Solibacter sp.]
MRATHTRAAILGQARGAVAIATVHLGEPGVGEVLLRMEACGICHSDLFVCGLEKLPLAPVTLGHEGIGRVAAVGAGVTEWSVGDRAGVTFLGTTCGKCEWCAAGRERFCPRQTNFGYTLQGVLGEYAMAPASALVRVPEEIAAAVAAPLCCAGWTAYGALREAGLQAGQSVALFGYGGLGHLALQMARHQGLRVAVSDPSEEKMAAAREAGAEGEARNADAAIVLTAAKAAIPQAFKALRRNGTLILVGLAMTSYELPLVDTVLKGITIRGSYLGSRADLAAVFGLAREGVVRPQVQMHGLDEVPGLLEQLSAGKIAGRAVIGF